MNYTQLVADIKAYTNNVESEFVAEIDRFIQMAERRIHMTLELPSAMKNVSGSMTSGNRFLSLPSDTIAVIDLALNSPTGTHTALRRKEEGFIREMYPTIATTGTPQFYSVYDHNSLLIGPTPDDDYAVEMTYHGVPTSIVSAATTWVGDNAERALLYAALVEGYTFMKGDPDVIQLYEAAYQEEIMKLAALAYRPPHRPDLFEGVKNAN